MSNVNESRFGRRTRAGNNVVRSRSREASAERQESKIYVNIGYFAAEPDDNTIEDKYKLVTLPYGIALDTMNRADERTNSPELNEWNVARNDLMDQLMERAEKLEPGEAFTLEVPFVIEVRCKNERPEAPKASENRLMRKFNFDD